MENQPAISAGAATNTTTVVWFRDDLRLEDHPALTAAATDNVVCIFVLDEVSPGIRELGGATKWWLHHSLVSLSKRLARLGIPLILRSGPAAAVLFDVVAQSRATRVVWNRRYGGAEREVDTDIKATLRAAGIDAYSYAGNLLHEPGTVMSEAGTPYRVYSAFWRQLTRMAEPAAPLPAPSILTSAEVLPVSDDLAQWRLLPHTPDWAAGFSDRWAPGEPEAHTQLDRFLSEDVDAYDTTRDRLGVRGTSELSPHLRWGEISSRQVWHAAVRSGQPVGGFLSEIGWREFAWHTLYHQPDLHTVSIDARFDKHAWRAWPDDQRDMMLTAWRRGKTGFGVIDAGMRELWHTGTMHNRARMVVASLLTKNLGIDWREGERWFWDTLVDADQASNPFNWQWVAGCGLDAAPYFRIFNPELQAKKFDPDGAYQSQWAPDSLALPPLVDLRESRIAALARYDAIKNAHA